VLGGQFPGLAVIASGADHRVSQHSNSHGVNVWPLQPRTDTVSRALQ
jgi:hypothetical protein